MGFQNITFKMPTDFTMEHLRNRIGRELRLRAFSFHIENKSLDARNKANIHWLVQVVVKSDEIKKGIEAQFQAPVAGVLPLSFDMADNASSDLFSLKYPDHDWSKGLRDVSSAILALE